MKRLKDKNIIIITSILLILIALITVPFDMLDATDVKDYSDTAKFFAGEYKAKHRAAHSILYGLLLSPFIKITDSFILIKLASAFWLVLVIISIYYISGKDRKSLLLSVFSPLAWYMAPWLSPVLIVSLLFLWAYYFLCRFDKEEKIKYAVYSGILIGMAAAFWDSALYFSVIFLIAFFYNKKFFYSWIFIISVIVGILPRLIADQVFYNFAFYGILKNFLALLAFALYGGIYENVYEVVSWLGYLIIITFIPSYFYILYRRQTFVRYKKSMIFLSLCLLFILLNPHIRMLMVLMPIMTLLIAEELSEKQYKRQLVIFFVISMFVVLPYIAQGYYETNVRNLEKAIVKFPNFEFNSGFKGELIQEDLEKIGKEYLNQSFVVSGKRDDYKELAHFYWGNDIPEFVSIEDYKLYLNNETIIAKRRIKSDADPRFRTELWIEVGLGKNSNDDTNYDDIKYGISYDDNFSIAGFNLVKKYKILRVFEKST